MSILAIAVLLFAFGLIAQFAGAKPSAFDRDVMLALHKSGNLSAPLGPAWYKKRRAT